MIRKVERTTVKYFVVCDECGEEAPGSPSRNGAINLATEAGFHCTERWNGLAYVMVCRCPKCLKEETNV